MMQAPAEGQNFKSCVLTKIKKKLFELENGQKRLGFMIQILISFEYTL